MTRRTKVRGRFFVFGYDRYSFPTNSLLRLEWGRFCKRSREVRIYYNLAILVLGKLKSFVSCNLVSKGAVRARGLGVNRRIPEGASAASKIKSRPHLIKKIGMRDWPVGKLRAPSCGIWNISCRSKRREASSPASAAFARIPAANCPCPD